MLSRTFKDRADYVSVIVDRAASDLALNPHDDLYGCTSQNISGGHEYWGFDANQVYLSPETLEEGLLALEMRSVIERAVQNRELRSILSSGSFASNPSFFGFRMTFSIHVDAIERLAARSATAALHYKLRASEIAKRASGLGIAPFLQRYCCMEGTTEDETCANF